MIKNFYVYNFDCILWTVIKTKLGDNLAETCESCLIRALKIRTNFHEYLITIFKKNNDKI